MFASLDNGPSAVTGSERCCGQEDCGLGGNWRHTHNVNEDAYRLEDLHESVWLPASELFPCLLFCRYLTVQEN